ncbi:MAG: iron ABC transporter permease [Spirochaetaceae bacterium]|nr:MAG: iron ABC transporter permease [Spirochaetaceae bacterium]
MSRGLTVRFAVLAALLLVALAASVSLGSVWIPLHEVARVVAGGEAAVTVWTTVIRTFRLPRAATALLAGAGLGVSGLLMQTLFRNPLAGPFVLGISSGAGLGVAVLVLAGGTAVGGVFLSIAGPMGSLGHVGAATLGAAAVLSGVLLVARRLNSMTLLLLLGVLFGYAANALTTVLIHFADAQRIQSYLRWTFGSFAHVSVPELGLLALLVGCGMVPALLPAHSLNVMLMGDQYATSVGVHVRRIRLIAVGATALLSGTITAYCGPIGFVGVAVPHMARSMFASSDHRVLLPATALTGAVIAVTADIIARLPGTEYVLPLNAVTALFGAPVVAWVLLRRRPNEVKT